MKPHVIKKSFVIVAAFLFLSVGLSACTGTNDITPTPTFDDEAYEQLAITPGLGISYQDQVYCTVDGVELTYDLSYPKTGEAPYPLVIYVHGGSWQEGDKRGGAGIVFKEPLLESGFAFASINYRLSPEYIFPAHIQDVKCAVRFFRANAGSLDLDAQRITALGGSAGAHLVSLLGLTANLDLWEDSGGYQGISSEVAVVVDMFGPSDITGMAHPDYQEAFIDVFGEAVRSEESMWEYSPLAYVAEDSPPFLIMHGDADQVVSLQKSESLYNALQAAGVPSELIVVHGGGHSNDLFTAKASPSREELTALLLEFLNVHLGQ
jgi:acetyl esterase/lipase